MAIPGLRTAARGAAFTAAILNLATTTRAHEHHMNNIEEGHAISAEPIVRLGGIARAAAGKNDY